MNKKQITAIFIWACLSAQSAGSEGSKPELQSASANMSVATLQCSDGVSMSVVSTRLSARQWSKDVHFDGVDTSVALDEWLARRTGEEREVYLHSCDVKGEQRAFVLLTLPSWSEETRIGNWLKVAPDSAMLSISINFKAGQFYDAQERPMIADVAPVKIFVSPLGNGGWRDNDLLSPAARQDRQKLQAELEFAPVSTIPAQ